MGEIRKRMHEPYVMMLAIYALFIIVALLTSTPDEIFDGLVKIAVSRSVLLTDYIFVGGLGGALVNSALVGIITIFMLIINDVNPTGSTIMALWLTTGFALFGKNIFNMLPITFGVWIFSKIQREPFVNFTLVALLSSTLSPVVSGISFSGIFRKEISIPLGIGLGILVGVLFPLVSSYTLRVHGGYNLYNMGFAGGLLSTFLVAVLSSVGIDLETNLIWSMGNNKILAILVYIIFAGMIIYSFARDGISVLKNYPKLLKHTGRLVSDYYILFGRGVYFNMGLTGAAVTTIMLMLGCNLNGPVISGIFTVAGFSAFGKHIKNVLPLIIGAILSTHVNMWDPRSTLNTLAILFSTGLSPIAGQFGFVWGVVAGFLHVSIMIHLSFLNRGLNLYNNGFAAGFVALLLVPVISGFQAETKGKE